MDTMKCLICGMKINPNNYNLNACTYIEKNHINHIIHCPFCGVGSIYLDSKNTETYQVNYESLDEVSIKILDKAMKLEVFNGEFYEEAIELAKAKSVTNLFKELSQIEFMHARIHKRLGHFKNLPKLHKPDYTKYDTDQLLLEEAKRREEHAIAFYKKNSPLVACDTIKEVFKSLSDVEKQHVAIAENYQEIG